MTSDQRRSFWEWATKHRARGHRSAQSESPVFPVTPLSQMPCSSFATTNTSELHWSYSKGFPLKNVLNETIYQHCSIKKSIRSVILLHCFIQFLYWISFSWRRHQSLWSVWTSSFIRPTSPFNLSLVIDQWIQLFTEKNEWSENNTSWKMG